MPVCAESVHCISSTAALSHGEELLNHLVGDWTLTETLGGKAATHDVGARWMLNREYLVIHETSHDRTADGKPSYEAVVLLSADPPSGECSCLWLDTTGGNGLSSEVIGRGKAEVDAIPFVFELSHGVVLYNTFRYSANADTWQWTIESKENGKLETFGGVTLRRK